LRATCINQLSPAAKVAQLTFWAVDMNYSLTDNHVMHVRKNCSQLFFLYPGVKMDMAAMKPLEFIQASGLGNRNLVLFRDIFKIYMHRSENGDMLRALRDVERSCRDRMPHVREVFCIGFSAGALPAIFGGCHVDADAVWCFGPRPPSRSGVPSGGRLRHMPRFVRRAIKNGRAAVRKLLNAPYHSRLDESRLDIDLINEVVGCLKSHQGKTQVRLFYAPSNEPDAFVTRRICVAPRTQAYAVEPPRDYPRRFRSMGWDHMIPPILKEKGQLATLFPPFVSA
jgi:hypothetical protein